MKTRLRGIAVAVLALGVCTPAIPSAEEVADLKVDPPAVYAPLTWRGPTKSAHGFFFTDEQVQKIDRRIEYLEKDAARICVDVQIAEAKKLNPWIKIAAGILTGAAIGFCVAHDSHCGISK